MRAFAAFHPSGSRFGLAFASVVLVACAFIPGQLATAQEPVTRTWTGAGADSNWTTNANWLPGVPEAGDILLFPVFANRKVNVNDFPDGTTFAEMRFIGNGYQIDGNEIGLSDVLLQDSEDGTNIVLAALSGEGGVHVGSGTLSLIGENTYEGITLVNGGTLAAIEGALGSGNEPVDVFGGILYLAGPLTLEKPLFNGGFGTGVYTTGNVRLADSVLLFDTALFSVEAGSLTVDGLVTGDGTLRKEGAGRLVLSNPNLYTGLTEVLEGVVTVEHAQGLGSGLTGTVIESGATLELFDVDLPTEFIEINGDGHESAGAIRNVFGENTLGNVITGSDATINVANGVLTFANGIDEGLAGHALRKVGPGGLEFAGAGDFAGTLESTAGWISVQGEFAGAITVTGGYIEGTGVIAELIVTEGVLEPGYNGAPGTLLILGDLTLEDDAVFIITGNDEVVSRVQVGGVTHIQNSGFILELDPAPAAGESVTLIEGVGEAPILGQFGGVAEGATTTREGKPYTATYQGGPAPGNDFVLTAEQAEGVDLILLTSPLPDEISAGAILEISVSFRNAGPDTADNASVLVSIPEGALIVSVVGFSGGSCFSEPGLTDRAVRCFIDEFEPAEINDAQILTIRYIVNSPQGTELELTISAEFDGEDRDPSNNLLQRDIQVVAGDPRPFKARVPAVARDGLN